MKFVTFTLVLIVSAFYSDKIRMISYNGSSVKTTFDVPAHFYGTYKGLKTGYLTLNEDGTGEYRYDVFGFGTPSCKEEVIRIEWGFLIGEEDSLVTFEREYGLSYPMLMKSTGATQFQGCRKEVMLDFIMEYKDGRLGVSSSDDWEK